MLPTHRPSLAEEELNAINDVFESRWLGKGSVTDKFEEHLCKHLGTKHVLCVNSGTAALHLAVECLELNPGFEVLVPSMTFPATIQAIVLAGGHPIFCEVEPTTLNIDIEDAKSRLTPKCRVIMPVHYAGQACDMDKVLNLAQDSNLTVVEDAAQSFGSTYKGRPVGTLGHLTCFSFDPIKNITCGGGGAIATDNDELAARILPMRNIGIDKDSRLIKSHSKSWKYEVVSSGYRYLMSNINAAIGLVQLKKFAAFKDRKHLIVNRYNEAFSEVPEITPLQQNLDETFPFSYVIRASSTHRDSLITHLKQNGIDSTIQFTPNHLQPAFSQYHTDLPTTEGLFSEILTIPLFYEMTDTDVNNVIDAILRYFRALR
ncbi:MAG: DegT/DnrJ/EryC1/StrS family aminotransferase [Thiohalomonadales bacterium]